MSLWAVVPVKALAAAKGRLAPALSASERRALAEALLTDVLAALAGASAVERVLVVSDDPEALALAARLGATPLAEEALLGAHPPRETVPLVPRLPAADAALETEAALNRALDQAAVAAWSAGAAGLLALPADLPLVTPADVAALAADPLPAPSVVLAATLDGGTGALLRRPPLAIPACFGPVSLRAHLAAAGRHGCRARLVWRPNLALDVDAPADLERLVTQSRLGEHTRAWLAAWRGAAAAGGRPGPP